MHLVIYIITHNTPNSSPNNSNPIQNPMPYNLFVISFFTLNSSSLLFLGLEIPFNKILYFTFLCNSNLYISNLNKHPILLNNKSDNNILFPFNPLKYNISQ